MTGSISQVLNHAKFTIKRLPIAIHTLLYVVESWTIKKHD